MEATIIQFTPTHLTSCFNEEKPIPEKTTMADFIRFQIAKPHRSETYISHNTNVIKKLESFSELKKQPIYTYTVTEDFLREFEYFLKSQNLRPNTVQGIVVGVQTMCKKAAGYGYRVSGSWDEFKSKGEKTCGIALSMNDITRIFYFEKLTIPQKKIRDLFVIGCLTGLRYSDYSRLTTENIKDGIISMKTKKTGAVVHIPMHPFVEEAIARNKGRIPASGLSLSYFNRYVKLICEKVGLTELISNIRTVGFDEVREVKRKCDMIGTHTARRSFATNMYNSGRFTTAQIMLITGHSSEKSFFKYIKITPEDNAKAILGMMKYI